MKTFNDYKNPALAVDLVVFGYDKNELSVLLLNRREEPFKDHWTLAGAFLQTQETFLEACSRTLKTKLGMDKLFLEQLYSFDTVGRDPRGRVISVAYYALVNPGKFEIIAGKMANDAKWFPIGKLPKLGFDHKEIFEMALQRLRSKILYFPVGFELLDELFTMTELQDLYECILNTSIDRRNFRKKFFAMDFLVDMEETEQNVSHRPGKLYKFDYEKYEMKKKKWSGIDF